MARPLAWPLLPRSSEHLTTTSGSGRPERSSWPRTERAPTATRSPTSSSVGFVEPQAYLPVSHLTASATPTRLNHCVWALHCRTCKTLSATPTRGRLGVTTAADTTSIDPPTTCWPRPLARTPAQAIPAIGQDQHMENLSQTFTASLPESKRGGIATAVRCALSVLHLKDGTELRPPAPGVTAIVGPNNAGKSTLLREVHNLLGLSPGQVPATSRVVASVSLDLSGTDADLVAWLLAHARVAKTTDGTMTLAPIGPGDTISPQWVAQDQLHYYWNVAATSGGLGSQLRGFFAHYANTENRLLQSHAAQVRNNANEPATHPVQALEDDRRRLTEASQLAQQVFHENLYLDDYSAQRRLKVGHLEIPAPPRDSDDSAYRDALLALPELAEQGDGMRSFFGQLLPLLARTFPLVLIDEPEAFLHPPQAALLGRALGDLATRNHTQLLLATHDRHLLTGLMDSGVALSVVRIDRHRPAPLARQLPPEDLRAVWSDPAVRYSNALDGLFHRLVVLVEGDGDARFYAAALAAEAEQGELDLAPSDVLFVPCNGKGGMAKLAAALVGLGVPVVASPDIDVLQKPGELKALLEALGGVWQEVADLRGKAVAGVETQQTPLLVRDLIASLPESDQRLDTDLSDQIKRFLRTTEGGWSQVKAGGVGALGSGGTGAAAAELLNKLDATGLVVVRQGELESFDHGLNASKSRWVAAALEADVHRREGPRAHVKRLVQVGTQR